MVTFHQQTQASDELPSLNSQFRFPIVGEVPVPTESAPERYPVAVFPSPYPARRVPDHGVPSVQLPANSCLPSLPVALSASSPHHVEQEA
jgi:hypothetical protein